MERLTMTTNATSESGASSPLSVGALATPAFAPDMPKRRRTSACDDLSLLHFTSAVREELSDKIGAVAQGIMESMGGGGAGDVSEQHWRLKSRRHGVEFYDDREPARRGQARFCCVSTAEATVEDVAQIFVLAGEDELREQCRILYDNVVNAKVLSVLEYPSPERPYRSVYVRYTAFETPKVMRSHRDMLVIVATDVITFPDGSTVGYCVWDSLHLSQLTALDIPPGFVRSRMFRSGYYIHNSGERNALTKVAYIVGIEAGGFAPRFATRFVMPRFGAVLERVCQHVKSKKSLDPRTFVLRSQWANADDAQFCQCCLKDFPEQGGHGLGASRLGASLLGASRLGASRMGATRIGGRSNDKRTNCYSCGEVVCSSCAELVSVDLSGVKRVKIPVCIPCRTTAAKPVKAGPGSSADTFKPARVSVAPKTVESIWL